MYDTRIRPFIDPPLNALGMRLARAGVGADTLTFAGLATAFLAALAIHFNLLLAAAGLVIVNRLLDGLDGAVARATSKTDRGGFLDIVFDFAFYGAVPFAFATSDPQANALPAAALLLSFYLNGATFLGFAIMAEKRGLSTDTQGKKSLYYLGGLAEGAETIAVFFAMCLFPGWFAAIAWCFAAICLVSASARVALVLQILKD